ncbi:MAG: MarR family transcriptional regulator [Vallitaleaceae bacterium]|nr:MarR family transcriptional regulator [Vallitaleaceae bacterium]
MSDKLMKGAETVSLFCRLNINTKKDLPIRSSEMGLLIFICKSDKLVTPVMAADFFKVKKPMITSMVLNLLKHEYIEKIPSLEDKRSFSLNPTEKARQLVDETYSEYMKTMKLLRHKLGANDFGKLVALLERSNTILLEGKNNG